MTSLPPSTSALVPTSSVFPSELRETFVATPPERRQPNLKLILFRFGQQVTNGNLPIYFGVYIHSIQHIYGKTTIYSSGKTLAGIVHVDNREVTTLDLCRYLSNEPLPEANYLITLRLPTVDLLGIPLAESPILVEVSPENIRSLPSTYRHLDQLGIANQVAMAETEDGIQTAFLLDLDRLVGLMTQTIETYAE